MTAVMSRAPLYAGEHMEGAPKFGAAQREAEGARAAANGGTGHSAASVRTLQPSGPAAAIRTSCSKITSGFSRWTNDVNAARSAAVLRRELRPLQFQVAMV